MGLWATEMGGLVGGGGGGAAAFIGVRQRCIRGEGTSEAAPQAVRQAVGGGCQSGWGPSFTNAIEALGVRETVAGHRLGAVEGGYLPTLPMHLWG